MKKVLSLILALAMVLSCVPFVFAEGEAEGSETTTELQMVYDLGEAFLVDESHVFTTDMAASYPLAGLPSATDNEGTWSVGYYASNSGAYDTFTKFPKLFRYRAQGRSPQDTVNTTVIHGTKEDGSKINANDDGKAYPSLMWSRNVQNEQLKTDTLYYPLTGGAQSVYGDGGYARNGANCDGGAIGYSFNSGISTPSSLGYQTNATNNHQHAVLFTAPRSGYIQPNLTLKASNANVYGWQLYKLDAEGVKTQIYPRTGDETMSLEPTFTGAVVCDEWKNGWLLMSTTKTTFDSEKFWVNEGEQLILRFGASTTSATHKSFEIGNFNYTYLAPTSTFAAEYDTTQRVVDFRSLQTFPEASDFAATSGLTETDVDGVFTVNADFVSGTTVTITETLGTAVHTITATLTQARYHYDAGEAWYTDGSYGTGTDGAWYYPTSLTSKYKNDGTSTWSVGYYGTDGLYDTLYYYDVLGRRSGYRAYEDPNTARSPLMVWGKKSYLSQGEESDGSGYHMGDPNHRIGAFGYTFGLATFNGAAAGWSGSQANDNQKAVIFNVPRDGIIKPYLKMAARDENSVAYRLEKISPDGTRTTLLPATGGQTISAFWTGGVIPEAYASGWGVIADKDVSWTEVEGLFRVEKGDKLELRFAALGASKPFDLNTYTIDYVQPETDLDYTYDGDDRLVDFRPTVLAVEDMMLTAITDDVKFIVPASLTATETNGVFTIAEDYVDGTPIVVTVQNGWNFLTINTTLEKMKMVYDMGEMFAVTDTFAGTNDDYPSTGLTPVYKNDGSNVWSSGYYTLGDNYGTISYFKKLMRYSNRGRAPEDTTESRSNLKPLLTWIDFENKSNTYSYTVTNESEEEETITETVPWYCSDPNGGTGSIGYSFGTLADTSTYEGTSALGWNSNAAQVRNQVVVFKAPRSGVLVPAITMTTATADRIVYRMDKIAADGTVTPIYPMAGEATVTWTPSATGAPTVPTAWANGWGLLATKASAGWTTLDDAVVRVNAGDEIILRFAAINGGNSSYAIDSYTMTYHKEIGADDELFLESPLTAYEQESYTVMYPDETAIDLRRALPEKMGSGVVPAGTVEYSVSGNEAVLEETSLPGYFALTGALNYGGEATVVTAGYYSPGKSSAEGDAPRFTVSTEVYVRAVSTTSDTFTNTDYAVDVSQFGFGEGFFLPYYADSVEQALYGTVDLGLTDYWKGALVSFSANNVDAEGNPYFEYLGNGRIRALAKYDYTTAGGTYVTRQINADHHPVGDTIVKTGNNTEIYPIRGAYTTGTPVTMTVTAKDGGVKTFSLWAFPVTLQDSTLGYDSYKLDLSATLANPIMKLEAYRADGTTDPMYPDSMNNKKALSPDALDAYVGTRGLYAPTPMIGIFADGSSTWMLPPATTYNDYVAPAGAPYVDYDGASWTFTAPKSGNISLSDYTAFIQTTQKANYNSNISKAFKTSVRLYENESATEYTELFYCDYKHQDKDEALGLAAVAFSDYNTITVGDSSVVTRDAETGELSFAVEKGQVVRVVFYSTATNYNGYATLGAGVLPDPVFTYEPTGDAEVILAGNQLKVFVADDTDLVADGVLVMLYDAVGNLVETVKTATIADDYAEVAYASADAAVSYAKLFFFDSLDNIKPLSGDIVVRK